MTEAEKRTRRAMTIREARSGWATVQVPDLAALLAEIDRLRQWEVTGREWIDKTDWMQSGPTPVRWLGKHRADALRDEITLLRAAIDRQPASPPSAESIEWASKAFLADSLKENEALRAEVDALRADAERLSSLAYPPFCDEYNEVDLHEQAAIYASAFGREEPNRDDYLAALRDAVDAFARAVERAAYERAAALCGSPYSDETDDPYECGFNRAAEVIADAIRALGEQHD